MWGKILTNISQELGWEFQSGKGFYNINFGITCELWYFCWSDFQFLEGFLLITTIKSLKFNQKKENLVLL